MVVLAKEAVQPTTTMDNFGEFATTAKMYMTAVVTLKELLDTASLHVPISQIKLLLMDFK
jgi:hypothetical protein